MYVVLLTFPPATQILILQKLRDVFMARHVSKPLHVTVGGPYEVYPKSAASVAKAAEKGRLLLAGVGGFDNGGNHVVYLKVQGPWLRRVWDKPDYPIKEYGFTPHLTLYEGADGERARAIQSFLDVTRIELLVERPTVTVSQIRHGALWPAGLDSMAASDPSVVTGTVDAKIVQHARQWLDGKVGRPSAFNNSSWTFRRHLSDIDARPRPAFGVA